MSQAVIITDSVIEYFFPNLYHKHRNGHQLGTTDTFPLIVIGSQKKIFEHKLCIKIVSEGHKGITHFQD